jgi:hypothetical protein
LDVIANATSGDDRLDLSNILSSFDATTSSNKTFCSALPPAAAPRSGSTVDGGSDSFVDLVNLVGVSADMMGLLNNGNLEMAS